MLVAPILLVEDNPDDALLTLRTLRRHGLAINVVVAHDGAEAMDYLLRQGTFADRSPGNPALMLVDGRMPRLDGPGVLKLVKSDPALRSIPVVGMLSTPEEVNVAQQLQHPPDALLVKPLRFDRFMEVIRQLGIALP